MGDLLLEIGTEEIPASYLDGGLRELKTIAQGLLRENRIDFEGDISACGTLRRLVLLVQNLSPRQLDLEQEITGPPKKIAYDEEGNPTKVAYGFAKKHDVSVDKLVSVVTKKGEYIGVKNVIEGKPTLEVLSNIIPGLIQSIPWPKSMKWGDISFLFVRPIHWILALLDGKIIPLEIAGVKSGDITYGHRFMSPEPFRVKSVKDYFDYMKLAKVTVMPEERKDAVKKCVNEASDSVSGHIVEDNELLSTVTNMIETPNVSLGSFDPDFLSLPDTVLITSMREHQRYFSIIDRAGKLMPHFVAVNNTEPKSKELVRRGHERVLHARLSDARFFFQEDRKRPLLDRLEDLKRVVFHQQLGTLHDKVERISRLAEYLAEIVRPKKVEDVRLTCKLCKCDLVTQMVSEFPSLQGMMGEIYAGLEGYKKDICLAISDHYLPVQSEGKLPESVTGAIVGLADRMDTIVGSFALGLEPTGTADPYALRRKSLGIIRLIKEKNIKINLGNFIRRSAYVLSEYLSFDEHELFIKVSNFIKERFKNLLLAQGISQDIIEVVISIDFNFLHQIEKKIEALRKFKDASHDFETLAVSVKRIGNIVKGFDGSSAINKHLFESKAETDLWMTFLEVKDKVENEIENENYFKALNIMAKLGKPVNEFFSQVMVMAEDPKIRDNRLGMLNKLNQFFLRVADFSKFNL